LHRLSRQRAFALASRAPIRSDGLRSRPGFIADRSPLAY
jgi:hypothetical protein